MFKDSISITEKSGMTKILENGNMLYPSSSILSTFEVLYPYVALTISYIDNTITFFYALEYGSSLSDNNN